MNTWKQTLITPTKVWENFWWRDHTTWWDRSND